MKKYPFLHKRERNRKIQSIEDTINEKPLKILLRLFEGCSLGGEMSVRPKELNAAPPPNYGTCY